MNIDLVLYVLALICFVLDAIPVIEVRVKLFSLGFAFLVATLIF